MQHFLMVFYVVFFSTGFMGGAALGLLALRLRSRLIGPLLIFQLLFSRRDRSHPLLHIRGVDGVVAAVG